VDGTGWGLEGSWVSARPCRALLLLVTVLAASLGIMVAVAWFGPPAGASSPLHYPGRSGWTEQGPNRSPADPSLPPVTLSAVPPSEWAAPVAAASLAQTITVTFDPAQAGAAQAGPARFGEYRPVAGHGPDTWSSGAALSLGSSTGSPGATVAVQGSGPAPRSGSPLPSPVPTARPTLPLPTPTQPAASWLGSRSPRCRAR
jgi:hypothetical protein